VEVPASAASKPLSLHNRNRTLLISATSIVGLHVVQEIFFGQTALGSFVSNLLQILCAVIADCSLHEGGSQSQRFHTTVLDLNCTEFRCVDCG